MQKNCIAENVKQKLNCGQLDQYYKNNHQVIVSKREWSRAQEIRNSRKPKECPFTSAESHRYPVKKLRTDIRIEEGLPEQAFIMAWNSLTGTELDEKDDLLAQYRIRDLNQLIDEYGKITEVSHELILRALDHIEIMADGTIVVKFLAGVGISIDFK